MENRISNQAEEKKRLNPLLVTASALLGFTAGNMAKMVFDFLTLHQLSPLGEIATMAALGGFFLGSTVIVINTVRTPLDSRPKEMYPKRKVNRN